jgi:hypothetical protein
MTTQEKISSIIKGLDREDKNLRKSRAKIADYNKKQSQCRTVKEFQRFMVLESDWRMKERRSEMSIEVLAKALIDLTKLG